MNAKKITKLNGITATVLRSETDNTNGGITRRINRIVLIGEFDDLPKDPLFPVFRVKSRGDYIYAEPVEDVVWAGVWSVSLGDKHGWMNGGNFAYAGNGWFYDQVSSQPIAIHDRSETKEEYEIMSR